MNLPLFIIILFVLQSAYWLAGRRASRQINDSTDYFLAGKRVTLLPLMMTFFATQVGGGGILGGAEEAYRYGWIVFAYPLGMACGLMALGLGFGKLLASFPVSTVAEIMEVAYGSPMLRKVTSLLSILSLFMILSAQIMASQKFMASLGFDNIFLFTLFWAIVIAYTVQGGLKAVISTDMAQASLFSAIFIACLAFIALKHPQEAMTALTMPPDDIVEQATPKLWGWLLMPLFFMAIEQDMAQRCFAGASPKTVSKAAFFAGVATLAICLIPLFLGTMARTAGVEVPGGSSVLMAVIIAKTNPLLAALAGCAILAAILSTATSLINALSSNVSNDFSFVGSSLAAARITTTLLSTLAIFFAFFFDSVVDLLIQSYELSVSTLFVPVVMAVVRRRGSATAAASAMMAGGGSFFLFRVVEVTLPIPLPKEVTSILLSVVGYTLPLLCFSVTRFCTRKSFVIKS